jgi:hypothetical protein
MKPIFSRDNMNRANAEFWAKKAARFKARVNERPGDVRRALDATAKQFERDRAVFGTEIDAMRSQGSLEAKIFELEEIEAGQTRERNSSKARLPRPRRPNPIRMFVISLLKMKRNLSNSEILAALTTEDDSFWLSTDKKDFVNNDAAGNEKRLAISGVPSMISKLRKKVR